MVDVMFVNDTTPVKVTSETQVTKIAVKSSTGTDNHDELSNRDLPDQHPISAITGLQEALDEIPADYVSDAELEAALLEKQDVISDLAQIRSGALLGSTAVQPNELLGYATEEYVDTELESKQDALTPTQMQAVNSGANTTNIGQISTNTADIADIDALIPNQASTSNQLADKDFVNSSIATNTANFIGTFNSVAELEAYSGTLTNNDYAFVSTTDTAGNTLYDRYKWNGSEWLFEYELNNSSFTAVQWAAINSGATTAVVELAQSALQPSDNISELNNDAGYITGISSSDVTSALGYTPQDTLVSGTNIKTINNVSLLGSGNIEIGGTIDTEISTSSTNAVQNKAIANYIISRGENLVSNGFASLGNNYNFSEFVFDGSDTYGAGGCFSYTSTVAGSRGTILSDELMPVDITQSYKLSYAVKNSTLTATYDYLNMYDIDGYTIAKGNVGFVEGTTTTLAQELKDGDTKVYLTNISDTWKSGDPSVGTNQYYRGLIFWNYQNSYGYQYPIEYYSRNWWYNLWKDDNDVDKINGVITLKSAWNHGTFPAGTPVSQANLSGGYAYGNINYIPPTGEWTEKSFIFTPDRFLNGTSYIRLGWLYNYSQRPSNVFKISSISLTQNLSIKDAITSESYATGSTGGVVKVGSAYGTGINNNGYVITYKASNSDIDAKTHQYRVIVPYNLDYAVKTGVTTNTITLTSTEQKAAQDWLGVTDLVGDVETLINAL